MKWLGLFSTEKVTPRDGNLLDTLCARMENLMKFEEGERDFVMLQHKFVVEYADGKQVRRISLAKYRSGLTSLAQETITSTLEAYGDPTGHSAMALYVGVPCGIAVQLVLDGVLNTPGVHAPYSAEVCNILRAKVEEEGLGLTERVL